MKRLFCIGMVLRFLLAVPYFYSGGDAGGRAGEDAAYADHTNRIAEFQTVSVIYPNLRLVHFAG